ncbi:hypothetical protein G7Y79_00055g089810 [Physcia stellaris]|nr:hypothetical protein G7Y79_00055g089810 [Physcia stellaris]
MDYSDMLAYVTKRGRYNAWKTALKDLEQRIRVFNELTAINDSNENIVEVEFCEADRVMASIANAIDNVKTQAENLKESDLTVSEAFDDLERLIAVMKQAKDIFYFDENEIKEIKCIQTAIDAIIIQSLKAPDT